MLNTLLPKLMLLIQIQDLGLSLGESRVKIIKATEVKEMGEPGVIINKNLPSHVLKMLFKF